MSFVKFNKQEILSWCQDWLPDMRFGYPLQISLWALVYNDVVQYATSYLLVSIFKKKKLLSYNIDDAFLHHIWLCFDAMKCGIMSMKDYW